LRAIGLPLSGEEDFLPLKTDWRQPAFVFSADLSSATDLIDQALLKEVTDYLGIPLDLVSGGTIDGVQVVRGTLMGIPMSWPCLSLIHYYVCRAIGAPKDSFYLKGDDLIAYWTAPLIRRYKRQIEKLSGMQVNDAKSFLGRRKGFFCEKAYILMEDGLHIERTFLSSRCLAHGEDRFRESQLALQPLTPVGMSLAPYLARQIPRVRSHQRVFKILRTLHPRSFSDAKRVGNLAFLPVSAGGLGLIPPRPDWRLDGLHHVLSSYHDLDPVASKYLSFGSYYHSDSLERHVADRLAQVIPMELTRDMVITDKERRLLSLARTRAVFVAMGEGCTYSAATPRSLRNHVSRVFKLIRKDFDSPSPRLTWTYESAMRLFTRTRRGVSEAGLGPRLFRICGRLGIPADWLEDGNPEIPEGSLVN
jgi:hypothetical protein